MFQCTTSLETGRKVWLTGREGNYTQIGGLNTVELDCPLSRRGGIGKENFKTNFYRTFHLQTIESKPPLDPLHIGSSLRESIHLLYNSNELLCSRLNHITLQKLKTKCNETL